MAVNTYFGTSADFIFGTHPIDGQDAVILSAGTVKCYTAETGGTQYDMTVNGQTVTSITVGNDGQIPSADIDSVDVVNAEVWVSINDGPRVRAVPQGLKGAKGDKGDTGAQGPQGVKGDTGPQGPQGLPGVNAVPADEAVASYASTDGTATKQALNTAIEVRNQAAEKVSKDVFKVVPVTPGVAPFQVMENSYDNAGGGVGTYNHAFHLGWNAAIHNDPTKAVAGARSIYMGFEDNYFDTTGGDGQFGVEWYVGYTTPDGTTIGASELRPFYWRLWDASTNAPDKGVLITMDLGSLRDANSVKQGALHVYGGLKQGNLLFTVSPDQVMSQVPILANAGMKISGTKGLNVAGELSPSSAISDRMGIAVLNALPNNADGAYVGWANGIAGTLAGDLLLVPRTSVAGAVRLYGSVGGSTPALAASATSAGIEFPLYLIGKNGANQNLVLRTGATTGNVVFVDSTASNNNLTIDNSGNLSTRDGAALNAWGTVGFKIGGAATQKFGFWGATPSAQPAAVANVTGGTNIDTEARTALNALLGELRTIGLIHA